MDTLVFILSELVKPLFRLESVFALFFILIAIFLFRNMQRALKRTVVVSLVFLLLTAVTAPVQFLVRGLENKFETPTQSELTRAGGIIVLGGALIEGKSPLERRQSLINENGERLTASLKLLREFPQLSLIYSTYSGQLVPEGLTETDAARSFYSEQGVDSSRIIFESKSRNTYENAKESLILAKPGSTPWILITSATHMSRSVRSFEAAGWSVIPYPVDYQTGSSIDWSQISISRGISLWNRYLHESAGSVLYFIRFQVD